MKWGIVGAGMHAELRVAPALAGSTTQKAHGVVGSSERKAREFANRTGVPNAYSSLEAMLADAAIDAVYICTPNDLHRRQTELAARVKLGLGFHLRHHPVHREIRALISSGELGEVVVVRGEWHTAYPPWQNWRADPVRSGSDVTGAVAVHVLDLLGWFAGADVRKVAALVDRSAETRLDQTIACALEYANGVMGTASATRRAAWPLNSVQVWGSRGSAAGIGTVGPGLPGRLRRTIGTDVEERELPMVNVFAAQFEAFARAVENDEEPDASGLDGLRSAALVTRILASGAE